MGVKNMSGESKDTRDSRMFKNMHFFLLFEHFFEQAIPESMIPSV